MPVCRQCPNRLWRMLESPYLFDVTRLISRSWTRRQSTGLDRVSYAYLQHFSGRAHAVLQIKGLSRILNRADSEHLFELLSGPDAQFRQQLLRFAPKAYWNGAARADCNGAFYINVSHTEFDLDSHSDWIRKCRLRSVYLIHDLIPILHPEFCRPRAVRRHLGRVRNALQTASGIILNSQATADDLTRFALKERVRTPAMRVIPIAGASISATGPVPAFDRPYFVCVGTIEPRKNHMFLLSMWEKLAAKMGDATPRLVIIGQWGAESGQFRKQLERSPLRDGHVSVLSTCSDGELGHWIEGARALLMPTRAEGFGLPLVEALRMGTPVIGNDLPSLREMGQGIPTLLAPSDEDGWSRLILDFTADGPERQRQLAALPDYRPQSWSGHFLTFDAWLESLPEAATSGVSPQSLLADGACDVPFAAARTAFPGLDREADSAAPLPARQKPLNEVELDRA
jgi:glycosyltransferase involved in cell wall biosynthesis